MPKIKTSPELILRAAWPLFHRHGYYDTSLQQIATAAGLGKAGVLHHFGSKAGVMHGVIEFALSWYRSKVLGLLKTEAPFEERLATFMRKHFDLCRLNDGGGCFFANTILETGIKGEFATSTRRFHQEWTAAAERFFEERYSAAEAQDRAYRLFADYQGSVVLFKLYQDDSHLERLVQRTLASL